MDNVFDYVADFYEQDPEWNSALRQNYVDNYLRTKSWQGADNDRLMQIWEHITMLCIFLGNSENFLGDMRREDFIDCVGWCGRNVSDFPLDAAHVADFLDTMADLYSHLQKKKVITKNNAPAEAKAKLIVDGKLQLLDSTGHFQSQVDRYNLYSTPDLPAKVFLNIGERLNDLMQSLQTYFSHSRFRRDVERANFLYGGVLLSGAAEEKPGTPEYLQCFWDYFLFDYHMIENDKIPLQHFYDEFCAGGFSRDGKVSRDVLLELLKAELVLFSVEGRTEDGLYSCINVFTGQDYMLMLPIGDDVDTKNMYFMGHIFYNNSMVMNCLRGTVLLPAAYKRFMKVMKDCKAYVALRNGGKLSWKEFIARYPIFLRHVSLLYAAFVRVDNFDYETNLPPEQLLPQPIRQDEITHCIAEMMRPFAFSAHDIFLAQTMWADFVHWSGKNVENILRREIWAAGIIDAFIWANGVYNYDSAQISTMCWGVPPQAFHRTSGEIKKALSMIKHDPRYINEEGLLILLLS